MSWAAGLVQAVPFGLAESFSESSDDVGATAQGELHPSPIPLAATRTSTAAQLPA
jgi:hypothetical protein